MGAGLRDISPKEVLSAPISKDFSGNADHTVIAAVTGKKIVVIGFFFTADAANTLQFFDGPSDTTPLTGPMTVNPNAWIKANYNPDGHFETTAGNALVLEAGGAVVIGGWINYYLE